MAARPKHWRTSFNDYLCAMRILTRRTLLAAGTAAFAVPAQAAPSARLIDGPWTRFGGQGDPDYSGWARFLDTYLVPGNDGIMRVRYAAARRQGVRLTAELAAMQAVDPTRLSRDAAMAFWINLYNALTIDLVIGAGDVSSIKQVQGGIFNTGPWGEKVVAVAGRQLSLDDIEHGILRPVWKDPRIHYGVNCASLGCPDLASKPYTTGALNSMLDAGARAYASHPRGARQTGTGAIVSSIYDWFQADFGGTEDGVLAHLNAYRATPLSGPIRDYDYDWALNGA